MKNWLIKDAVKVLLEGTDIAAIKEITARYPVFALAASRDSLSGVAELMGDKFTLNRLKKEPDTIVAGSDEDVEEKMDCDEDAAVTDDESGDELDEKSVKELISMCDKLGIKVPRAGKNKRYYIDKIRTSTKGEVACDTESDEKEEDWEDVAADPYEGKTARELHAMCKERGIKVDIKKPAKVYADLLRKADEESKKEDDSDDGWGDDEAEPVMNEPERNGRDKKKNANGNKNVKAAAVSSEDEEDDWDI